MVRKPWESLWRSLGMLPEDVGRDFLHLFFFVQNSTMASGKVGRNPYRRLQAHSLSVQKSIRCDYLDILKVKTIDHVVYKLKKYIFTNNKIIELSNMKSKIFFMLHIIFSTSILKKIF